MLSKFKRKVLAPTAMALGLGVFAGPLLAQCAPTPWHCTSDKATATGVISCDSGPAGGQFRAVVGWYDYTNGQSGQSVGTWVNVPGTGFAYVPASVTHKVAPNGQVVPGVWTITGVGYQTR